MASVKKTFRLNQQEQDMLARLLTAWRKSGRVANDTDVLRKCLRDAYNHLQRSNGKEQVPPTPGDIGGELRTGRPRKERA